MIIQTPQDVTAAVLGELGRIADPRLRTLLTHAVQHLHGFISDAHVTEAEFQQICALVARLGQLSTASHNEVVLAAGSLGVSSLVCLLNNGELGRTDTTANLLGPFWRQGAPACANGDSIVRCATPGPALFVTGWIQDRDGQAVEGAEVDVWHSSPEGFYENQDPSQTDMNLRGTFCSDAQGRIAFRTVKPAGYPIPVSGPVGALLRAQGRHNLRPAHIHFMIRKSGFKTQFSQVYSSDDPNLETDVQFAVTRPLVGQYVLHDDRPAPEDSVRGAWYSLEHRFVIEPGQTRVPQPPITGRSDGERPVLEVLTRRP